MIEKMINVDVMCKGIRVGHVLVPGQWDMDGTILLCKQLGGKTTVVESQDQQQALTKIFLEDSTCPAQCKSKVSRAERTSQGL